MLRAWRVYQRDEGRAEARGVWSTARRRSWWRRGGRLALVTTFALTGEHIAAIEIIADPQRLAMLTPGR